jgi:outer membrane protein TolC
MKKTMSRRLLFSIGCAVFLPAGALGAEQQGTLEERLASALVGGLTADQVAARAQDTSNEAAAQRDAIRAAEARLEQAKVAFLPRMTLTGSYTRLSPVTVNLGPSAITFPQDQFVGIASLDIPLTDYVFKLSQSYAAASHSKRAEELNEQAARLKAAYDGRVKYYSWLQARAGVIVSERALDQSRAHLEDARHAFEVGTSSKADVLSVESQVASAELLLERSKNLAALTEDQIRTAMHDPSGRPYEIGEDLRGEVPPLAGSENLAALRAEAFDRRLELRALDQTAWSLREQAKAARTGYYPHLDAIGNFTYAKPNARYFSAVPEFKATWQAGVQLVWSPNDALQASGASGDPEARASQTEKQKAALFDGVKIEVMQAWQAMREAEVAVGTTRRGLAAAEEGYRVRHELFRNGRATSVELTDAEVALFRASLESVNARADLRAARARLIHATGRDVPQGVALR